MNTSTSDRYFSLFKEFLRSDSRKVLILKGPWGIGKTHLWKEFLIKNPKPYSEDRYAYVSLFGVSSISELTQRAAFGSSNPISYISRKANSLLGWFKSLKLPAFSIPPSILAEYVLNDYLICIDDIERRSDQLKLKEIFGLVDMLRQQKNCRVVLILNDLNFAKNNEELRTLIEKVVDVELEFSPSQEELTTIIFKNQSLPEVVEVFKVLELSNLRTMQRVKWCLEEFSPYIRSLPSQSRTRLNRQITIFTIFHSSYSELGPLEVLGKDLYVRYQIANFGEPNSQTLEHTESRLHDFVRVTEYSPSAFDSVIVDLLKTGFINKSLLKSTVANVTLTDRQEQAEVRFLDLWSRTWHSFATPIESILEETTRILSEDLRYLGIQTLKALDGLLKVIDSDPLKHAKIVSQINHAINHASDHELEQLQELQIISECNDAISTRRKELRSKMPIAETLERIGGNSTTWFNDFDIFASIPDSELTSYLLSTLDGRLMIKLKNTLVNLPSNESGAQVFLKLKSILDLIASKDALNKKRVGHLASTLEATEKRLNRDGISLEKIEVPKTN